MKTKITRNELYRFFNHVYCTGYCELQYLLYRENARFYNAGTYGWNYDVYVFGDTAIVTGYRPIGDRIDYDLAAEYDKKAQYIMSYDSKMSYDEQNAALKELLSDFLTKIKS